MALARPAGPGQAGHSRRRSRPGEIANAAGPLHRLSTGRPFPDGQPGLPPACSLVLNCEDSDQDTVRPRLQALGANLGRVFSLQPEDTPGSDTLRLPSQTGLLEKAVAQTGARLVVLDPIVAFLEQSVLTGNDQSVRRALLPLARLADRHRCVVHLARHLNKGGGRHAVYRGGGSIGFVGACRSAWLIARDPQTPGQCVLAQVKNNLGPPQESLAYAVVPHESGPPTLSWRGSSPWTADQLLAGPSPASGRPGDRSRVFLEQFLADGPQTSRAIWAAAQEQGLSSRTLNRAKKEMEIRSQQVFREGRKFFYWLLPGQELSAALDPKTATPTLDNYLTHLREQYPPSTPLDEL